MIIVLIS